MDAASMRRRFANWPLIQICGQSGIPAEIYRIKYQIKGLCVDASGNIVERESHELDINLSLGYPRRAPQCRMVAPVFHPNFDDASVCIGDFWAASEGLDDLVIRIGRMIAYQEYNTRSPLNGLAAKWTAENLHLLPIDNRTIAPPTGASESTESGFKLHNIPVPIAEQPVSNPDPGAAMDPWSEKIIVVP